MSEKLRLRATMTVEVEYKVLVHGTDNWQKVIEMEQKGFNQDPANLLNYDGAQHWVNVKDITNATTDQMIDEVPIAPWSPDFNVAETQTDRITRAIEIPLDSNKQSEPGAKNA